MAPTTECEGRKTSHERRQELTEIPWKTPARGQKQGNHNLGLFLITKYSKIAFIEDSLLSSIHDINLWQRKRKQKYICINSYICHVYISNNHFKSLWGKTIQNKHHRAQDRQQKEKRRASNSSYTPAALQINTIKNIFFSHFQNSECTNLLLFSLQIDNFSSKSFKYSTKCTMNMEWRCKPGIKIHYLLTSFVARFFLNKKQKTNTRGTLRARSQSLCCISYSCCFINKFTRSNEPKVLYFNISACNSIDN